MKADIINILLAFFEGFALIISPCILPILPLILSGSLTGSKARPYGIIIGFITTFTLFALFSRIIINSIGISPDLLRYVSFTILILFGLMMVSTYLTEKFTFLTSRLMNIGQSSSIANNPEGNFFGGFIFGGLIGLIWTPCAGPILAAVIVQTIVQHTTTSSLFVIIAFAIGAGLPMLFIALIGRKFLNQLGVFRRHALLFRKILGYIIIASVLLIIYLPVLPISPDTKQPVSTKKIVATQLINGLQSPYLAPDIAGIQSWINSQPLTMASLKGKVVLIDFWTYSCINCIRTLPYLKDWYAKYHALGFEIIGVHSPEFVFEKDPVNVANAVKNFQITYPVALDNHFVTWQNFNNRYWPAHYLINKQGFVIYEHFGEGEYDVTENNIRFLLGLDKMKSHSIAATPELSYHLTPETYLGYARGQAENLNYPIKNQAASYTTNQLPALNQWSLAGNWIVYSEKILAMSPNAAINLHYSAKEVYAVMGSHNGLPIHVKIRVNGKSQGEIVVKNNRLYTIIQTQQPQESQLTLTAETSGLEVYTFTFG